MRKSICAVLVLLFIVVLAAGNSGPGAIYAAGARDSATLDAMAMTARNEPNPDYSGGFGFR